MWARHIDYIAELVGHQYVGLGLDFVPQISTPGVTRQILTQLAATYGEDQYPIVDQFSIAGPGVIAGLTQEMSDHGYSDEQIVAILGSNWLRVFEQNWAS